MLSLLIVVLGLGLRTGGVGTRLVGTGERMALSSELLRGLALRK